MTLRYTGRNRIPLLALLLSWAGLVILMVVDYVGDPPNPAPDDRQSYGYHVPGELLQNLLLSVAELGLLLLVLRPWSYRGSWGRALLAFVLIAPWWLFYFVTTLHAGPVTHVHAFWLLGLALACLFCTVYSLAGRIRHRYRG